MSDATADRIRLDKWLWHIRAFKSRSLAAQAVESGRMRVNGQPVGKPGRQIGPGDVLTFVQGKQVRLLRVLAPGTRRGPPAEARTLYLDLDAQPQGAGPDATEDRTGSGSERPITG